VVKVDQRHPTPPNQLRVLQATKQKQLSICMGTFIHSNRNKKPNPLDNILGGLNNLPSPSTMEPISVLSTIGAVGAVTSGVCKLAMDLYEFIKSTQNVNEAVTGLVEEVNALKSILETVKQELDEVVNLPKMH